jgi:hypothetical protein
LEEALEVAFSRAQAVGGPEGKEARVVFCEVLGEMGQGVGRARRGWVDIPSSPFCVWIKTEDSVVLMKEDDV